MSLPEKHRIRSAFERAAESYDAAAVLQRRVCDLLLEQLVSESGPPNPSLLSPQQVLDAGCGTGYGARILRRAWPHCAIVATDFAPAMAAATRRSADTGATCTVADIERLPFAASRFDLWWSSLTVQWCDPVAVLNEAHRVLKPGGQLALSTLGPGTYAELRDAFGRVDRHRHTLDFSVAERLVPIAEAAGFTDVSARRRTITLHYPDLRELLGAVKAIGANALGDGRRAGMMGRRAWQALFEAYEGWRTDAGLPASYDVILLTATRR